MGEYGCEFEFFKHCLGGIILEGYCSTVAGNVTASYNLKDSGAPVSNDDIARFRAHKISEGTLLKLYDSPDGKTDDDWCEIIFKKNCERLQITDIEQIINDKHIRMLYFRDNGLKGKVSRIEVVVNAYASEKDYPGYLAFHKDNSCEGALSGCINDDSGTYNFKDHDSPGHNDDARSVAFFAVRGGRIITLYDSPHVSTDDDYCIIAVNDTIPANQPCGIPTFEKTASYDNVQVTYYKDNGLDGKVSYAKVDVNG
ncbi:MAG: hypothetical protein SWO11_14390 [Thermodesulfobacteriota bacterium]|nr:hypothetical protein [Thermodesulfobacteriota bacterium]